MNRSSRVTFDGSESRHQPADDCTGRRRSCEEFDAKRTPQGNRLRDEPMRWLELRFPPTLVGITVAATMWVFASFLPIWPPSSSVRLMAGVILLVIGIAIAQSGIISLRRAQTTVDALRPEASTSLVSSGIFARTRNPTFLGMLIALLAWAIYLPSALALLGPVAFFFYITRFQVIPEERALHSLFGSAFSNYSHKVRRWL